MYIILVNTQHTYTKYMVEIMIYRILHIECDSTLYVGMTRKQNGGPIHPIRTLQCRKISPMERHCAF